MRRLLVIFCTACLLASCNPPSKFRIVEADKYIFNGLTSVHGKAVVASSAGKDLVVESAVLDFRYKDRLLATARLMLPIEVPAGQVTPVRYDLRLESESLSNLQTLQNRVQTNATKVSVDITAWVHYGKIRRKIETHGVLSVSIISNFEELKLE